MESILWTKFDPQGLEVYDDGYFDSGTYWKNAANVLRSDHPSGFSGFMNEFTANVLTTVGSVLTPKDHHENYNDSVDRIASAASSTVGDNMLQQGASVIAATISEASGTTDLIEAGYGVDVQGNTLTGEQRVMKGTSGTTKVAGTIAMGASLTESALARTTTAEATAAATAPEGSAAQAAANKGLGGNPFKGKTAVEIDEMFRKKGFDPRGPDPVSGKGGYVNENTGRSYHIDEANSFGEKPHVDINRPKDYKGPLEKKKLPMGDEE